MYAVIGTTGPLITAWTSRGPIVTHVVASAGLVTRAGRSDSFTEWLKVSRTRGIEVVTDDVTVPDTLTTLVAATAPAVVEGISDVARKASVISEAA